MTARVAYSEDWAVYWTNSKGWARRCCQFLDRFRAKSAGRPKQLSPALGPDIIKALAQRSGLSEEELTKQLSQVLPGVVDKLTPAGQSTDVGGVIRKNVKSTQFEGLRLSDEVRHASR